MAYRFWAHHIWAPKIKVEREKKTCKLLCLSLFLRIHKKFTISFLSYQILNENYNRVHPSNITMNVKKNGKRHCNSMLKPDKTYLPEQQYELIHNRKFCCINSCSLFLIYSDFFLMHTVQA